MLTRKSNAGAADALQDVWGNDAVLFYREMRPSLKRASLIYQLRVQPLRAYRYRETKINSDVIRVNEIQDEKVIAPTVGYLIKDAIG